MIYREIFCNFIKSIFKDYEIEALLDVIERCENTEYFIIDYLNETVLIYDTINELYISWYKVNHIGRSLSTNIPDTKTLRDFLIELYDEIFNA